MNSFEWTQNALFAELPDHVQSIVYNCTRIIAYRCRQFGYPEEPVQVVIQNGYVFIFANPVIHSSDYVDEDGKHIHAERRNIELHLGPANFEPSYEDGKHILRYTQPAKVVITLNSLIMRVSIDGTELKDGENLSHAQE